jgi:hypothetical protein
MRPKWEYQKLLGLTQNWWRRAIASGKAPGWAGDNPASWARMICGIAWEAHWHVVITGNPVTPFVNYSRV